MVAEESFFGVRLRQSKLLLRKNWLISRRSIRSTVIQIFVPFFFVFLLFVLKFGVQGNELRRERVANIRTSRTLEIADKIPRCIRARRSDTPCISLAYVINSDGLLPYDMNTVITNMADASGIPTSEIRKFDSSDDLDNFCSSHPNITQAAVIFNVGITNTTYPLPGNLTALVQTPTVGYSLMYNQSAQYNGVDAVNVNRYLALPLQTSLERELSRVLTNNPDAQYKVSLNPFPHPQLRINDVIATNGPAFFFAALMFNVVIQVGYIVTEKEFKLREGMNVMGLKDSVYWFTWWVTNTIFNTLSVLVLIISGYIFQFDFFLKNDFGTFFFLFFLFGLAMVPIVFVLSTLVSRANTATTLGFLVFLIGVIIQGLAAFAFRPDFYEWLRYILCLLPFSLLSKGISDLSETISNDQKGMRWADRTSNAFFTLEDSYKWLVIDFFIYFALALYLDNALPRTSGRVGGPFFLFKPSFWGYKGRGRKSTLSAGQGATSDTPSVMSPSGPEIPLNPGSHVEMVQMEHVHAATGPEDSDVVHERLRIAGGHVAPVTVSNLLKKFSQSTGCCSCCGTKKGKGRTGFAVDHLNLSIEASTLFCLLGHNGAGKTTTINMLTGMFGPTSGDALICGYSILDDMPAIRKVMGVCPQHDILWDQMTGKEHLELFAGFKGIPEDRIQAEVQARLDDVDLSRHGHLLSMQYSGGMKRRLSTAIALTGDPQIVFLDEPTTGMDPVSRRQVWNLIEKVKRGRIIVLTTHSMEEADVLGDRVGIMSRGRLVALGTSLHLKNKFGAGYQVVVMLQDPYGPPEVAAGIKDFFAQSLGVQAASDALGIIYFNIPRTMTPQLPEFFEALEVNKERLGIGMVQLSMTTLEEVFLSIAGHEEEK
eukprot:TRINITY_DN1226_c0_g1_i1.p1 TRINITY_DN1226_c0_g1~~TRINITY_DN1226_c0_g1_i1.p1  ORF type:complete len:879 (-),score=247.94 TRINITY_DN1226_c0_g1_i1:81-2717(-)